MTEETSEAYRQGFKDGKIAGRIAAARAVEQMPASVSDDANGGLYVLRSRAAQAARGEAE